MNILIVEDDIDMQKILKLYLEKENFNIYQSYNVENALKIIFKEKIDLILLDWMLPNKEGLELINEIKLNNIDLKIIMLTAKDSCQDEITALIKGADDYIRKPFDPKILILRIKKLLNYDSTIKYENLTLNLKENILLKNEEVIKLTKKEFELIKLFIINKDIILKRELILNKIWGMEYYGDERTLDTHIRRLRNKIGIEYIKTHIGIGYSLGKIYDKDF